MDNNEMTILKNIMDEAGIKEHMPADLPWDDPDLIKILEADPGSAAFFEDDVLDIAIEIDKVRYEIAERIAGRDALQHELGNRFRDTDPEDADRIAAMDAFTKYKKEVEKKVASLEEIRQQCLEKVRNMFLDEAV